MKSGFVFVFIFLLSGCIAKQEPVCTAMAFIGGKETTVQIYDVRQQANQTQYKAGYPFNWQWVSKSNFTLNTCDK